MQEKIARLYPGQEKMVAAQLNRLIQNFLNEHGGQITANTETLFSEKDVMLSCYGDHVQQEGEMPLFTLHRFLQEFALNSVNRVHILPFYPYTSDDGFSVVDYYQVNTSFGNWEHIQSIGQDFGLMFDCVANHVSAQNEWFLKFLQGDEAHQDYFISFDQPVDLSQVFRPRTHPLLTPFDTHQGRRWVWTTFSEDQIDLNFGNPQVFIEIIKVLLFYVANGATAVRLDAIAYAWKKMSTSCFDLPEVHAFVQLVRDIFNLAAPHVWLITETVLPHQQNISYFGDGHNEAHVAYHFQMETLLLHTLIKQDATVLANWLADMADFSDRTALLNLAVSHDGIHTGVSRGILSDEQMQAIAEACKSKGGEVLYRTTPDGGQEPYEFNITYPSAIGQVDAYLASKAILLAMRGVPFIYFNDFIGAENWREGVKQLGYSRAINRQKFDYHALCAELKDPASKKYQIYNGLKKLIQVRINEPLFSPTAKQQILLEDSKALIIKRFNADGMLVAITNVTDGRIGVPTEMLQKHLDARTVTDICTHNAISLRDPFLCIEPFGSVWLK
jgi:sucrose phosphorylase